MLLQKHFVILHLLVEFALKDDCLNFVKHSKILNTSLYIYYCQSLYCKGASEFQSYFLNASVEYVETFIQLNSLSSLSANTVLLTALSRVCHKSMAHPFRFSSFSRYRTEKIVFIYNKAQTFTSSGFAFPQKNCIFAENFFKYGKDTNKI